jgi:hypothetical protein
MRALAARLRLRCPVVMAVVAAVVMWLCKRRGREQQHQGQDNQLLHAAILPRMS